MSSPSYGFLSDYDLDTDKMSDGDIWVGGEERGRV